MSGSIRGLFTILYRVSVGSKDDRIVSGYTRGYQHTIAVDSTMRARLLAVAFDFLAPAFITGTCHPSSFLRLRLGWLIVADVISFRVFFTEFGCVFLMGFKRGGADRLCRQVFSCCEGRGSHGWQIESIEYRVLWLGGCCA